MREIRQVVIEVYLDRKGKRLVWFVRPEKLAELLDDEGFLGEIVRTIHNEDEKITNDCDE